MKTQFKLSVIAVVVLGVAGWLFALLNAHATTTLQAFTPFPPSPAVTAKVVVPSPANSGVLDQRRQLALGMIETGNRDHKIGRAGEVSRYQIMPSVWRHYSDSRSYQDPDTSLEVAQQHWAANYARFKRQAHREPADFDMYVLWNTSYGYYANHGFNPARLDAVVRENAQRFVNLVQRGDN